MALLSMFLAGCATPPVKERLQIFMFGHVMRQGPLEITNGTSLEDVLNEVGCDQETKVEGIRITRRIDGAILILEVGHEPPPGKPAGADRLVLQHGDVVLVTDRLFTLDYEPVRVKVEGPFYIQSRSMVRKTSGSLGQPAAGAETPKRLNASPVQP